MIRDGGTEYKEGGGGDHCCEHFHIIYVNNLCIENKAIM